MSVDFTSCECLCGLLAGLCSAMIIIPPGSLLGQSIIGLISVSVKGLENNRFHQATSRN